MAIDASALFEATIALSAPCDFNHIGRVQAISGRSVAIDQTNFFPNLSGQPSDQGKLIRLSDDKTWEVTSAEFDGRMVWHEVAGRDLLKPGDEVLCSIDKGRRLFFSRSHSAAVLLSGLAHVQWNGCVVTSCNLSLDRIRLDFSGGARSDSDVETLLNSANEIIADGGEVTWFMATAKEALENPQYLRSRALEGEFESMGELARVVQIHSKGRVVEEQFDLGTHVHHLREIGRIGLQSSEQRSPYYSKGHDHFRVRFRLLAA